jgi:hypothetical protein
LSALARQIEKCVLFPAASILKLLLPQLANRLVGTQVSNELLWQERLADVSGYLVSVFAESLALDLANLSLRKYPETLDADSVCNIAVSRWSATSLQARKHHPAERLMPTSFLKNYLGITKSHYNQFFKAMDTELSS